MEIDFITKDIVYMLDNLLEWMAPNHRPRGLANIGHKVRREFLEKRFRVPYSGHHVHNTCLLCRLFSTNQTSSGFKRILSGKFNCSMCRRYCQCDSISYYIRT